MAGQPRLPLAPIGVGRRGWRQRVFRGHTDDPSLIGPALHVRRSLRLCSLCHEEILLERRIPLALALAFCDALPPGGDFTLKLLNAEFAFACVHGVTKLCLL